MAFSKIVARPLANPSKRRAVEDEYEYYKKYVRDCVNPTKNTEILHYLQLNTALFRMLEVLLDKFHDIDARNSIAGDIIFHSIAICQALNQPLYMEDGRGSENRRQTSNVLAYDLCISAKITSNAFTKFQQSPSNKAFLDELIYELGELIDATNMVAEVSSLHELLTINLQRRGKTDRLLEERCEHIRNTPYMKLQLERCTIYPLFYGWPTENTTFCTLLKQAGVDANNHFLLLQPTVEKIHSYVSQLITTEYMTEETVEKMLINIFGTKTFSINIRDVRTLLCPVARALQEQTYAAMWNNKYPQYGYILSVTPKVTLEDRCQSLREDVLSMRAPQGWNLENMFADTLWRERVKQTIGSAIRSRHSMQTNPMMVVHPQPQLVHSWQPLLPTWLPQRSIWQPQLPTGQPQPQFLGTATLHYPSTTAPAAAGAASAGDHGAASAGDSSAARTGDGDAASAGVGVAAADAAQADGDTVYSTDSPSTTTGKNN